MIPNKYHCTKKLSLKNIGVVNYRKWYLIILTIVMIVGFSTSIYLYMLDKYSLLYYGDAVSHLVRAREFVNSARPGLLEQIGTGWLPLPHLLLLPTALEPLQAYHVLQLLLCLYIE